MLTAVVEGNVTNVEEGSVANVVTSYKVLRGTTDVTDHYTFGDSIDGILSIKPVEIEITAASDSKEYDGNPLTNDGWTITGGTMVGSEKLTVTVEGTITYVGTTANVITSDQLIVFVAPHAKE